MSSSRALAVCSLLVVMLVWGTAPAITKVALSELPPFRLALLRFVVALILLLPLAQSRGGLALLPRPLPLGILVLMGLSGVTLYFVGANLGLVYTSAADVSLILGSTPAVTAVLAVFLLHEAIDRRRAFGIAVSIVGIGLIVLVGRPTVAAPNSLLGNLLALLAVLAWAVYTVLAKSLHRASRLAVTAYSSLAGTILLVPFAAYELQAYPTLAVSPGGWLAVVYLGAIASAAAYLLWNYALRSLDASQAASFINLIPLIGVATATLFLGETLAPGQLLGGALILAGIWLSSHAARRPPRPAIAAGSERI
jgi:drug/metabolite transporter (DMT)-like permease